MGGTVGERTFEALLRFLTEAINRILISSGVYRSAIPWGQGDHIGCDERRVCVDGGAHFVNWPPSRANTVRRMVSKAVRSMFPPPTYVSVFTDTSTWDFVPAPIDALGEAGIISKVPVWCQIIVPGVPRKVNGILQIDHVPDVVHPTSSNVYGPRWRLHKVTNRVACGIMPPIISVKPRAVIWGVLRIPVHPLLHPFVPGPIIPLEAVVALYRQ